MFTMNRVNKLGLKYMFTELFEDGRYAGKTKIETEDNGKKKSIVVSHSIEKLSQAWYNWMMKGDFIQSAFHFMSDDEREFIMSGTTKEEWDEIFNQPED